MDIASFIENNESLLSALAALTVMLGYFATIGKNFFTSMFRPSPKNIKNERITLSQLSSPSPHSIQYAKSEQVNIAYTVFGRTKPTLIVTPGIISNLHVASNLPPIRDTMNALSRFARIINFDKRGQGLSDPTNDVATIEERVKDIGCVADQTNSEKFCLMGISEGGPMSIQYAVENPERVSGLILFGTTARFSRTDDFPMGFAESTKDNLVDTWGTGSGRHIFFPSISDEVIDDTTYRGFESLMTDRRSMKQIVSYMKTLDVRPLLQKIACPTLIIHFTGDLAVPIRMGRYIHSGVANSEFLEIAGEDHCDLANSPEAIDRIEKFISECSA